MTDTDSAAVPLQRRPMLQQTLRTSPATEDAVKALTRALAVELPGIKTPTYDQVIGAATAVAGMHMPLLVEYLKERSGR